MNAIPMNLVLAEKDAARKIVANQEEAREKDYRERKKVCAELHKREIDFNPSALTKELKRLFEKSKASTTAPRPC